MKVYIILILSLFRIAAYGQEVKERFDGHKWEAPYSLSIPNGWTIERFLIPIAFAPEIPYKGVEDIRFSPGWAKKTSTQYWSYGFLWYLDGDVKLDSGTIGKHLKAYYTGLVRVNGANISAEKIIPVETFFREAKRSKGDVNSYIGSIRMLDYMSQKPIVLNCKVHVRSCQGTNKTFVFYELSPRGYSDRIWRQLDKLWRQFKCTRS